MFDHVYNTAKKARSFAELKKELGACCIDIIAIKDGLILTAAAKLAREGHDEPVEWLRQMGANVSAIAEGYASVNNHRQVDIYRSQYKASIDSIAEGYAHAKNKPMLATYLIQGANTTSIAGGYVLAGDDNAVDTYHNTLHASSDAIAGMYAITGRHERVEHYRTQHHAHVDSIALGYASAGYHQQVETYFTQYHACADHIAMGYASAGCYDERVEYYQKQHGAKVMSIIRGYIIGGNDTKVEEWRLQHHISPTEIADLYDDVELPEKAEKYRTKEIERLQEHDNAITTQSSAHADKRALITCLDNYLTQRTAIKDTKGNTKEYFYGSFFATFQKSYTQKTQAVAALKSALEGQNVDLTEHLATLRNGHLGQLLRSFIKNGSANSLVGNQVVNTVRDFVQALQKNNQPTNPSAT